MTQKSSPIVKQSPQLPESHVMALALNADTMQIAHAANKAANLFFFIAIIVFVRPPNPNKQKKDVGVSQFAHPTIRPWLPPERISNADSPRHGMIWSILHA